MNAEWSLAAFISVMFLQVCFTNDWREATLKVCAAYNRERTIDSVDLLVTHIRKSYYEKPLSNELIWNDKRIFINELSIFLRWSKLQNA